MTADTRTPADAFGALQGEQFVVLTTFRRSGEAMPTPVWFAERDGLVYVTTNSGAGKVKRIANNAQVTVAASDRVGSVHGDAIAARARLLGPEESQRAAETLRAKYGEMYDQMTSRMDSAATFGHRVFLELTPA